MTPDQYRRAPIPADGRTIEAMRLALLDTPAGRAMTNAGDTRLYWMNESDAYMLMSPFINTTDDALEAQAAELARLREALTKINVGDGWAAQIARAALAEMETSHD